MIKEATIDQTLELFESEQIGYDQAIERFIGDQPMLFSYLISETEGIFTEEEQDFAVYLAIIIYHSVIKEQSGELPKITEEDIADAEEDNWAVMSEAPEGIFREKLDAFFENTAQEDLLAFVEDALSTGGETEHGQDFKLTPIGLEPMFVILKTVIDVLTAEPEQ